MKIFITAFITIFLAELGDKTQIATLLFAANKDHSKLVVFLGAASALLLTSAIGVLLGSAVSGLVEEKTLKIIGGVGVLAVGIWTIFTK
jgi:putative Ca2+/H+ antiporter (TMEM165/GDT1 family)